MREVFETANRRTRRSIAVDPRGLAAVVVRHQRGRRPDARTQPTCNASLDTLRTLAENTDGRAIVNRNDLATGMKQIIRDSSGYYLLGYNSTQAPTDGKFHEIKVQREAPRTRRPRPQGLLGLTADDVARATAAPPKPDAPTAGDAALNAIAAPERGRPARFWIGTARGENGVTRVTFIWEPVRGRCQGSPDRKPRRPASR